MHVSYARDRARTLAMNASYARHMAAEELELHGTAEAARME